MLEEQSPTENKNLSIIESITSYFHIVSRLQRTLIRNKQISQSEDRACADTSVKSREFLGTDQGTRELQLFLNCRANFIRMRTQHIINLVYWESHHHHNMYTFVMIRIHQLDR